MSRACCYASPPGQPGVVVAKEENLGTVLSVPARAGCHLANCFAVLTGLARGRALSVQEEKGHRVATDGGAGEESHYQRADVVVEIEETGAVEAGPYDQETPEH
jgi:hypothetical protein